MARCSLWYDEAWLLKKTTGRNIKSSLMFLTELPWLRPSHWLTKWVMLAHYFMMSFNNGALFVSFSAIQDEAEDYYNTSSFGIQMFSQSFLIMTIVTLYPV
mmetsp:Transcript_25727/g.45151  ORF Transcript_25727/g.45151 Transcript_25727/m.45151 type:complete len:101 (+) Transcript_25727:1814-2116(+)